MRKERTRKKTKRRTRLLYSSMGIEQNLAADKKLVERELGRFLPQGNSRLYQAMRYSVLEGGKRFRPLLLLASGRCFGVRCRILLPFACALEFIHSYSLVHDDLPIMDDDDVRRGRPSCHRRFGEDIALLAGDGLLTLAFEILSAASVPPELEPEKQAAVRVIARSAGVEGMIGGQFLDITVEPEGLAKKRLEEIILKKTGALIAAAVEIGAILGRASSLERKAISDFGRSLGLAFQIRDDLRDFRPDKSAGSAVRPDYVGLFGREKAEQRLKELVERALVSLRRFSGRAEELRFLTRRLLVIEPEASDA